MAKKPPPSGYSSWKTYWSYKKTVAGQYGSNPGGQYTIDIPGLKDIFIYQLPKSYSKQLKYERYQRFKTHSSPVPNIFNWIPNVITQLDNAQDLAYTALFLAKPLLRRLPSRFIPFVGWALLLMDIVNIVNAILGWAMTPGMHKPCLRKQLKKSKVLKKIPLEAFRAFISPGGWRRWLGFALQAPQAMQSLTGYGLQLGTIMGAMSDTTWAGIKLLFGHPFVFRPPPPSDPLGKAYNFLAGAYNYVNQRDILTPEEHALLIIAHNLAVGIVLDAGLTWSEERANDLMTQQVAVQEPWELSSLEVLEEVGHPLDEEIVPYTNTVRPTYEQIIQENIQGWPQWERDMRNVFSSYGEEGSAIIYSIYREAADDMIQTVTGVSENQYLEDMPIIKSAYELAACDIMPLYPPNENQLRKLLDLAYTFSEARGAEYPTCDDYRAAGIEIFGTMVSKMKPPPYPPPSAYIKK